MQIDHVETLLNESPIVQTGGHTNGMDVRIYRPDKKGKLKLKETVTAQFDKDAASGFGRLQGQGEYTRVARCCDCSKDFVKKQTRSKRCEACRKEHNRHSSKMRARKKAYDAKRRQANSKNN